MTHSGRIDFGIILSRTRKQWNSGTRQASSSWTIFWESSKASSPFDAGSCIQALTHDAHLPWRSTFRPPARSRSDSMEIRQLHVVTKNGFSGNIWVKQEASMAHRFSKGAVSRFKTHKSKPSGRNNPRASFGLLKTLLNFRPGPCLQGEIKFLDTKKFSFHSKKTSLLGVVIKSEGKVNNGWQLS